MIVHKDISSYFSSLMPDDDDNVLLVVPPFIVAHMPSLAVHILQACARREGFRVRVYYANLDFASMIGGKAYRAIADAPKFDVMLGERVFAATAYGVPVLGHDARHVLTTHTLTNGDGKHDPTLPATLQPLQLTAAEYKAVALQAGEWVERVASAIAARPFRVVGCTSMFEQTAASVALLDRVKRLRPDVVTIMGGPNCEDEMAEGIASLSPNIDYIFSGESEHTFVDFLQQLAAGKRPLYRIIQGHPLQDMDTLPTPTFQDYYQQLRYFLPEIAEKPNQIELVYESSRGCWWGEKHQCTFCGLNGKGMSFRAKSADKVLAELAHLLPQHPSRLVNMTDNIMPFSFFKVLLPRLRELAIRWPSLRIFYEQKANLTLHQVVALAQAGITEIQPGIESLSTSLLKRMDKGVTAGQNIRLLRYARATGMALFWALLYGFPGDTRQEYEETLALLPLLHHLEPPKALAHLSIERFSPYYDHPEKFGVRDITPSRATAMVMPSGVDVSKVAYHFTAEYACDSHQYLELMEEINQGIAAWRQAWQPPSISLFFGTFTLKERPILEVVRQEGGRYLLRDTRGLPGTEVEYELTPAQASVALVPRRYTSTPELEWAFAHQVGVVLDKNQYVPLATATPELLFMFEAEWEQLSRKQTLPEPERRNAAGRW